MKKKSIVIFAVLIVSVIYWGCDGDKDDNRAIHTETYSYELLPGFNMISISLEPINSDDLIVENQFPGLDVYTLDGGVYNEVPAGSKLQSGRAYLVMAKCTLTIDITGVPIARLEQTRLLPGWNMIGALGSPISVNVIDFYPDSAVDRETVHFYDSESGSYMPTDIIMPHCGHLVLVSTQDTVTVIMPCSTRQIDVTIDTSIIIGPDTI